MSLTMANQTLPALEIHQKVEAWTIKDGDFVPDHLKIILKSTDGDKYFYAKADGCLSTVIDVNALTPVKIPDEDFCPLVNPKFTRAYYPVPRAAYLKRTSLLGWEPGKPDLCVQVLTEIKACEVLRQHPHPNIAPYFGCVVKDGRIKGLVFKRYRVTLQQVLNKGRPFDRAGCMRGIEAGVRHMHRLGLVHNDLNPTNIMMDQGKPVIIDFDSCRREGDEMGVKEGTPEWALENADFSRLENDIYSLNKIRKALMRVRR